MPSCCYGIPESVKHQFQDVRTTPEWTLNLLSRDQVRSDLLCTSQLLEVNAVILFHTLLNLKSLQSVFILWNLVKKRSFLTIFTIGWSSKYWDVLCYSGSFLLNHSVPLCSRCTSQPLIRRHDDAILLCCSTKGLAHPFTVSPTHSFNPHELHLKRYTFPPAISAALLHVYVHMCRWLVRIVNPDPGRLYVSIIHLLPVGRTSTPTTVQWVCVSLGRSLQVTCVED